MVAFKSYENEPFAHDSLEVLFVLILMFLMISEVLVCAHFKVFLALSLFSKYVLGKCLKLITFLHCTSPGINT